MHRPRLLLSIACSLAVLATSIAFAGASAPLAVVGPVVSQTEAASITPVTPMSVVAIHEVAVADDSLKTQTLADARQRWRMTWTATNGLPVDKVSPPYHPIL